MKVTLLKVTDGYDELVRDCVAANANHRCGAKLNDDRYLLGNLFEVEKFQLNLEPSVVDYEQVGRDWGARIRRDQDRRGTMWTETCRIVKELYNEIGVAVKENDIIIFEYKDGAMAAMFTSSVYFDGMVPMFMRDFPRKECNSFVDTVLDNPENCHLVIRVNELTNIADARGFY